MKKYTARLIFVTTVFAALALAECNWNEKVEAGLVEKLKGLMAANVELRGQVEAALEVQEESSYWYGKNIEEMYDFFDQWLVFTPTPENGRKFMDSFYDLTGTPEGRAAVLEEPFRNWLYDFMIARGAFMDSAASAATLETWMENPEIGIEDYIVPEDGFSSFNDFFTRQIKPGARTIEEPDDSSVLNSPADCTVMDIQEYMDAETEINVKGDGLSVSEMFGGDALATAFVGGRAVLCMISTTDYHRFHSPVSGEIVSSNQLAGLYYGMTAGWVDYFFEHRRGYFIFDTGNFGYVGMVCVGMFTISSIEFERSAGEIVSKGDELGYFAYGGSAVILLFEPDRTEITLSLEHHPVRVKMGQKIGQAAQ